VLFLAADRDHLVPAVEQARLMASLAPHATIRVLEGHGHICLIAPDVDLCTILDEWTGLR
jgi:pimeloyl-ACP methyl ester carboxylesterase